MRTLARLGADCIWLLHFLVVVVVLFGWTVPRIEALYAFTLISVLLSNIWWDYCFLSKWEFDLRRFAEPELDYDYTYTSYYTHKLTRGHLSKNFLRWTGLGFTTASLVIYLCFAFVL
jgi:hypothetical protein